MSDYNIRSAFERIENELIASMIRNMKRHREWEDDEGFNWEQWQALQLKNLEEYKRRNPKIFGKKFREINKLLEEAILKAREDGNMAQELELLEMVKSGKFKKPRMSKKRAETNAEFFKMNDRKMQALIDATVSDMEKAETAILRMANDKYRKIIFDAQVYANSGAGTYEKAVDMATRDFLATGLNCVEYKNGARHTLKDYADMALRTASKRAYLTGEGEKRKEWGISTVIMNKRGNPCPLCLPFVGKVMIDDVWSGGSSKDGDYPLMSDAISKGLYHPRCRDSHTTYFEGISTPPDSKFTKKEVEQIEEVNKVAAKKQYAQRQVEKYERLEENSLDEENKQKYGLKKQEWEEMAGEFIPAKTIEESQGVARELGVKYAVYDDLPLETANRINEALMTIPEECRPVFVGSSKMLEQYRHAKLPRSSKKFYGVTIETDSIFLGIDASEAGAVKAFWDYDTYGDMVGISSSYKTAAKITEAKKRAQEIYVQKHGGRKWFFNVNGEATPFHEIGHVYANKYGLPEGFQEAAEKWLKESGCDMLQNPTEAWAEAWGAYYTNNPDLPDYIKDYIEKIKIQNTTHKVRSVLPVFDDDGIITEKIEQFKKDFEAGEISTRISFQKQAKHIKGRKEFEAHEQKMAAKGDRPSYIREDLATKDLEKLVVSKLQGKVQVNSNDEYREFVQCDEVIGYYYDKKQDKYVSTRRAQIKYALGDKNIHIIPVKEL